MELYHIIYYIQLVAKFITLLQTAMTTPLINNSWLPFALSLILHATYNIHYVHMLTYLH